MSKKNRKKKILLRAVLCAVIACAILGGVLYFFINPRDKHELYEYIDTINATNNYEEACTIFLSHRDIFASAAAEIKEMQDTVESVRIDDKCKNGEVYMSIRTSGENPYTSISEIRESAILYNVLNELASYDEKNRGCRIQNKNINKWSDNHKPSDFKAVILFNIGKINILYIEEDIPNSLITFGSQTLQKDDIVVWYKEYNDGYGYKMFTFTKKIADCWYLYDNAEQIS